MTCTLDSCHGVTNAIFILRQKFIKKNRNLFFAFVGLEKTIDRVNKRESVFQGECVLYLNGLFVWCRRFRIQEAN